mgnify:CR=1 FL=1
MKKKYIIKKNYYIQKIITDKKFYANKYFIIYKKENNLDHFRFVVSVGKKIGKAVKRNKIKRQIKDIIYQKKREIIKNYDILIIVRFAIKDLSYLDIKKYLCECLSKAKLIKE